MSFLGDLFAVGGGVMGGPWGAQAALGYFGDKQQAGAAKDAQTQNAALLQQGRDAATGAAYTANDLLNSAMPGVQDLLAQGYQGANDFATQGYGQQRSDILQSGQLGANAITQGMGGGLGALYAGTGQGIDYLNGGLESGVGAIGGRTDRAGAMLDQQGGLYGGLQMDPGFAFRQAEGNRALMNRIAAGGDRFGANATRALVDYNQGLASQEYNNAAQRRLSEYGAAQGADAQSLQAQNILANLYSGAANNAAGMAYGAGQGAANIYGQGGASLADLYGRTGFQLGSEAAGAGQALGGLSQDYYGGLGNLDYGLAQQMGGNLTGAASAGMGLIPQGMANNQALVPYAGQGLATAGNAIGSATRDLMSLGMMAGAFDGGGVGPGL